MRAHNRSITELGAGLLDVIAVLEEEFERPDLLHPTGRGGARVDRCHASTGIAYAATDYWQVDTGSDHGAGVIALDLRAISSWPARADLLQRRRAIK